MNKIHSHQAFTLVELMIVIILVGVLAGLAIPQYNSRVQQVKNREAHNVLQVLYGAQKEYQLEHGSYASDINDLDVEIAEGNIQNFKDLTVDNAATISCDTDADYLASLTDNDDRFVLHVLEDQTGAQSVVCMDCHSAICQSMGYQTF